MHLTSWVRCAGDIPYHLALTFDITKIIPIAAIIGENDEGFSILSQMVLPSIPVSESIQESREVPFGLRC